MQDTGYRIQDTDTGYRIQDMGLISKNASIHFKLMIYELLIFLLNLLDSRTVLETQNICAKVMQNFA